MNKKAIAPIFVITIVAALAAALYFNVIDLGSLTGSSSDFVKPSWARLECAPTDGYEGQLSSTIAAQSNGVFKCDANTDECEFDLKCNSGTFLGIRAACQIFYYKCDLNGNSCGSEQSITLRDGDERPLSSIESGSSYKFKGATGTSATSSTTVKEKWKPWKTYRFVGGSKTIVNSYNCDITSGDLAKIRNEDKVSKLYRSGGEGTKWVNYVDDWVYGPATGIVNYNGKEAYCSSATIYEIVKLQMADGSLKKVNPSYNSKTPSGDTINGLGNKIASVECCPSEPNCGTDFKYKRADNQQLLDQKECFSDLQCFNAGGPVPIDGYNYVTYRCTNDKCSKSVPTRVECTTSAQCSNGNICDLSTTNYGKCIKQVNKEYCGDGVCQLTENHDKCAIDCDFTCPAGQTLVTSEKSTGAFCLFGYGICSKTSEKYCDDKKGSWFNDLFSGNLFFLIILIVGVILIIKYRGVIIGMAKGVFRL